RHQQVPRRVGELVQEDEGALAAVYDERLLVAAGGGAAKEAAVLLVSLLDVFEAPRRPELLRHGAEYDAAGRGARRAPRPAEAQGLPCPLPLPLPLPLP